MIDLFESLIGTEEDQPRVLAKHLGFEGMVPVTWAAAGGVLFGGYLVAAMTLMGQLSGAGLFITSAGLFIIGSAFGFVHGGVLGYLGRDHGRSHAEVLSAIGRAVLYSIPVLAVAWAIAGWIALTVVAVYVEKPLAVFGVGVGWLLGVPVLAVAAAFGARAFRQAFSRWPHSRVGTTLVGLSFAALVVTFFFDRPELWWTGREVGMPGPALLAGGVTVWLMGPVVTLGLWALQHLPDHPVEILGRSPGRVLTGVAGGLALGGLLGLAVHFVYARYGVLPLALWTGGAGEAVAIALSQGLLDEILLRLFVVGGLVWLVRRQTGSYGAATVAAAVVVAALLHVALYLPSLAAIGFPGTGLAVGYAVLAIFVPAVAYGLLFWWRGLASAVVAHGATVAVAALMLG